jgi:hypothetical protein
VKLPLRVRITAALLGVFGVGWEIASLRTFTVAATVAVLGFGSAELAVAGVYRRRRPLALGPNGRSLASRWFLPWGAAIVVLVAWELVAFSGHPRSHSPTISSMVDPLLVHRLVRTAAFAAWAWLGWVLAR